jgi:YgiT-type zinc finger domain-containing protein
MKHDACEYCGGKVREERITVDLRRKGQLYTFYNVPVGVCTKCGDRYNAGPVLDHLDELIRRGMPGAKKITALALDFAAARAYFAAARPMAVSEAVRITTCPTCGSKEIRRVTRDLARNILGKPYIARRLTFEECPHCGERLFDHATMQKMEAARAHLRTTRSPRKTPRKSATAVS